MPDRAYCPELPDSGRVLLRGDEAHHLARVRRIEPGEVVELLDGRGRAARAAVRGVAKEAVELEVIETVPDRRPRIDLTLATAVPKGERFDWLVEKATELGVARLVPLRTRRSTVDPRAGKLDRLRRIVVEAAKQCGRARFLDLAEPVDWADFAGSAPASLRSLADPSGSPISMEVRDRTASDVAIAIGPEGGWAAEEIDRGREHGWRAISLGPTILRIETAALAASAILLCGPPIEEATR